MIDKCYKCINEKTGVCVSCSHNPNFANHYEKKTAYKPKTEWKFDPLKVGAKVDRNNNLKLDRASGMTYKQLSEKYGICQHNARRIAMHEYREEVK